MSTKTKLKTIKSKKEKDDHNVVSGPIIDKSDLSDDQRHAAKEVLEWYHSKKSKANMIFRLGGVAGAGKSYLLRYILQKLDFTESQCYAVAFTGQAVNVLRQNGIHSKTIHSTFMNMEEVPLIRNGRPVIYRGVPVTTTTFKPKRSISSKVKLIVCDEASFLPSKYEELMLGYGVPILEVGDPIQLPPVMGEQCFTKDNLDYFMTKIMRQSEGSEIIRLANAIRNYEPIDPRDYGNDVKFMWARPTLKETFFQFRPFIKGADMITVATNHDRTVLTDLYRKHIVKTDNPYPNKGEKLICRKNYWDTTLGPYPLTNGTQGVAVHTVAKSDVDRTNQIFTMDFKPTFVDDNCFEDLTCDSDFLRSDYGDKDRQTRCRYNIGKKFEYAYVITVHSSQGSTVNKAMFFDSFSRDSEYHMRMRYTAVTRAKDVLYYVLPYYKNYPHWTDLWKGGR